MGNKITIDMSKGAYEIAKRVYLRQIKRSEGKLEINKTTGMNSGSAQDFITIFLAMMEGKEYHRTFNIKSTRFLLESIKVEFGDHYFKMALIAVQKHIEYYSKLKTGGNLRGLQDMILEISQ